MEKFPIVSSGGNEESGQLIHQHEPRELGQYQAYLVDPRLDPDRLMWGAYVVVNPKDRRDGRWNYTFFALRNGSLEPTDSDVELDPYHMCLLYQLMESFVVPRGVGLNQEGED